MTPLGRKQQLKLLRMRTRKELALLGYKRKEARWDDNSSALPESNQGLTIIGSGRLFNHKVHSGTKTTKAAPSST